MNLSVILQIVANIKGLCTSTYFLPSFLVYFYATLLVLVLLAWNSH